MAVEYRIFNVVKDGLALIAARTPRVQPSAQRDFGDHLSWMVSSDTWTPDPATGQPLSYEGKTLEQVCEDWIRQRPHALEPVAPVDPVTGECWLEGNLTKQSQRLKELRAFTGSDAAAMVLLTEEAALYGVKPGSTTKSQGKIDPKADKPKGAAGRNNPWSPEYSGEDAEVEKARLIKTLGSRGAGGIAAAAGVSIFGAPLKR